LTEKVHALSIFITRPTFFSLWWDHSSVLLSSCGPVQCDVWFPVQFNIITYLLN